MSRNWAILLLGPTGAGKTPLGDYFEARGLWGHRCLHFDFGAQLRSIASGKVHIDSLRPDELGIITHSLRTGALLEDQHFPIAAKILRSFIAGKVVDAGDLIILNGLPRHVGQARDIDDIVAVAAIISLQCSARTVHERIRLNSGGDRAGRTDDELPAITRKLRTYAQRTTPLLSHYQSHAIPVYRLSVAVHTTAEHLLRQLESIAPPDRASPAVPQRQ